MPLTDPSLQLLHRLEADLEVFQPSVDGFAVWPIMRHRTWQLLSGVEPKPPARGIWATTAAAAREVLRPAYAVIASLQRRSVQRKSCDLVFFSNEAYRSVRRDDGWWDVYLDDLANHPALVGRVLRCEWRNFAVSPLRTVAPRHLFLDAQVIDQVLGARCVADPESSAAVNVVGRHVASALLKLGTRIPTSDLGRLVRYGRQRAAMFRRARRWFVRLFTQVRPKALVITDAYSHPGVVAAARQCQVRVIEMQHGVIQANHPGYSWPPAVRAVRDRLPIPDVIASYGDFWSDILRAGGFWRETEVASVGAARMDWVRAHRPPAPPPGRPFQVVFTTQYPARAWIVPLWRDFLGQSARANLAVELVIKVHRMEARLMGPYRQLAREFPRVRVLSPYEGDTLQLIAAADAHASAWSTCHYEALGLGVPTIVLRGPGPDRAGELADLPRVHVAADGGSLWRVVDTLAAQRGPADADHTTAERLFRPDAIANMVALLEDVAGGRR